MIEGPARYICSGNNFLSANVRKAVRRKQLAGDLLELAARLQCLCCLGVIHDMPIGHRNARSCWLTAYNTYSMYVRLQEDSYGSHPDVRLRSHHNSVGPVACRLLARSVQIRLVERPDTGELSHGCLACLLGIGGL